MLEFISPLAGSFDGRTHGQQADAPGLILRDHPYGILTQLSAAGNGMAALVTSVKKDLGLSLPEKMGDTTGSNDRLLAMVGPGRYWLVQEPGDVLPETFLSRLPEDGSVMTLDLTHGRHRFRVEGAKAAMLLAKGTPVDVRQEGHLVMTAMGHVQTAILPIEGGFDLYPARSFARHLFGWCLEQGLEFGVNLAV